MKLNPKIGDSNGEYFENMILNLLLKDAKFTASYSSLLKSDHFTSELYQSIAGSLLGFYAKYRRTPDRYESINIVTRKFDSSQQAILDTHVDLINTLWKDALPDKEFIEASLIRFIQNSEAISVISQQLKGNSLDIQEMSKEFQRICSLSSDSEDLGLTSEQFINKLLTRDEECEGLSTGFPSFDQVMKHGFRPGELTVILGGTGGGKTTTLCNLGKGLLLSGAKVLHITLEMPEDHIMDRYIASITRIPIDSISEIDNIKSVMDELKNTAVVSPKTLRIKYMQGLSTTLDDIENYIIRLRATGEEIDIVIVDYADLIVPPRSYGKSGDKRLELGDIYVGLRNMGTRHRFPILTVSQINREGKKLGYNFKSGTYDPFPVKLQDFHMDDSQKKANHADYIFAIREPKVYTPFNADGKSKLFIVDAIKTRYGEKDQIMVFNMRFHQAWMEDKTNGFDFESAKDHLSVKHTLDLEKTL